MLSSFYTIRGTSLQCRIIASGVILLYLYHVSGSLPNSRFRYLASRSEWMNRPMAEGNEAVKHVTVTIEAPRATVTIVDKVVVHRDEIEDEPSFVNGPPTSAFRDNLRPEIQYITSWPGSGFTNDVMGYINLIYLALLTQRVPILPFFTPTHVAYESWRKDPASFRIENVPNLDFGEAYDIPRFLKLTGWPILEWWEVKDRTSETIDPLGCWNVWQAGSLKDSEPHYSEVPGTLKLDISYTTAPRWVKLFPKNPDDHHVRLTSLMSLGFPKMRNANLRQPTKSKIQGASLPPDEKLFCLDNLYSACSVEGHEMQFDHSVAWRQVGQYLHWNPKVEQLAQEYLRRMLNVTEAGPIPPFIAIHVRHGDFKKLCKVPLEECYAPPSAFARRATEMQAELLQTKGVSVVHAVITSDEENEAWWGEALGYGWLRPDHEKHKTAETYGVWYPFLIDAAIQSMAEGLVGTSQSTVSILAGKRVKSWNDGLVRMVKWGRPGADDAS